jgi:hypothetical protein
MGVSGHTVGFSPLRTATIVAEGFHNDRRHSHWKQ